MQEPSTTFASMFNNDIVSLLYAKGCGGMCRSIEAYARAHQMGGMGAAEQDALKNSSAELPTTPPNSSATTALEQHMNLDCLPKYLGGAMGEEGMQCCGEVFHANVSEILGLATLLRTFSDVNEEEVRGVGALISTLSSEHAIVSRAWVCLSFVHIASLPCLN